MIERAEFLWQLRACHGMRRRKFMLEELKKQVYEANMELPKRGDRKSVV